MKASSRPKAPPTKPNKNRRVRRRVLVTETMAEIRLVRNRETKEADQEGQPDRNRPGEDALPRPDVSVRGLRLRRPLEYAPAVDPT